MDRFANFIVTHKKIILSLYTFLILLSFITGKFVHVNYDFSAYLPSDLNSIKGTKIIENDFDIKSTVYVLLKDQPIYTILKTKKSLENLEGVKTVFWLDDVEDLLKPESFINEDIKKEFISGTSSLLQLQLSKQDHSSQLIETVKEIEKIVGEKGLVGGPLVVSKDLQTLTTKEMVSYTIVAFIVISIILFISMNSFIEPILFFIAIGVAAALNQGTNIIFQDISVTTNSVSMILQLAVSMDYSIFLLHRYIEEKKQQSTKEQAMIVAIRKTFGSVLASALTTICGFLALVVMKYSIGRDIGLVLAKGVLLSLASVLTLLPILILLFDGKIEKYQHKIYLPNFKKISHFIVKHKYFFLFIPVIMAVPAFLAQSNLKYYYANEKMIPSSANSNRANEEINQLFSNQNQLVILVPKGEPFKEIRLLNELKSLDQVKESRGLYTVVDMEIPRSFLPKEVKDNFESESYSLITVTLKGPVEGTDAKNTIHTIRTLANNYYEEWYVTGEAAIYSDLEEVTSRDFTRVTLISILLIGSVILIAFKSMSIPFLLVFIIQFGIWINLTIPYLQGNVLHFISFIIIGAIQLGATVDYAILFTSRFRENLENLPKQEAAIQTIQDTGRSILTSALILFTGTLSVSFITSISSASELTLLIGRGAIISLILVLVVLPSLLIIFNKLISKTTLNWPRNE